MSSHVDVYLYLESNRDVVVGYIDSNHTGYLDKRISLLYIFTIGSCAISWKATLQYTVALSTTEAEHMAIANAYKEAIWLKDLHVLKTTTDICDNQSAIFLT